MYSFSKYIRFFCILSMAAFLLATPSASASAKVWKQIGVNPSSLTAKQKKIVNNVFNSEFCYYGCQDTIASCLKSHPRSAAVKRIARMVVRMARNGLACSAIGKELRLRARSAHPFRVPRIDTKGLVPLGNAKAPVTVIMFADFQCPFCRKVTPMLKKLQKKLPNIFKVYFMQFPVKRHREGVISARASIAAQKQGKFWAMYERLYKQPRHMLKKPHLIKCAKEIGLSIPQFLRDLKASWTLKRVRKEKLLGLRLGVRGTPALFFNGKMYYGEKSLIEIEDRILEEYDLTRGLK